MKIGDKVRFLNTVGGGTVRGFQGKDVALVEDESGFELPILLKECVVIEPAREEQVRQSTKPSAEIQQLARKEEPEEVYEIVETKEGEQISAHLVYLANDIKNLSTSNFECYLVNDSNFYLSYNYMSEVPDGWISRANGVIEPNTKLFVEDFEREDLNDIERVCLQFIAYKLDKPFRMKEATSKELRIDTTKFYKLHSFKENDFFDENAIVYTVINKDAERDEVVISASDIKQAMMTKDVEKTKRQRLEKKQKAEIIEVDLHAHEVLESTAGLSNADILEYQLKIFRETMEENKKQKGQRIVFIHGKGEGVLKNALRSELNKNYKQVQHQDASFQEYGFGATMVTIR